MTSIFCMIIQHDAPFTSTFSSEKISLQFVGIQCLARRVKMVFQLVLNRRSIEHELNVD